MEKFSAQTLRTKKPVGGISGKSLTVTARYLSALWDVKMSAQKINVYLNTIGFFNKKGYLTNKAKEYMIQEFSGDLPSYLKVKASLATFLLTVGHKKINEAWANK